MMGVGFTEMLIVAGIALVFLGPEKFPDFAKIFIRTVRDVRTYMDDVKSEVAKEVLPMQNELKQLSRHDAETYINKLLEDDDEKTESADSPVSNSDTFSTDKTGITPESHEGGSASAPTAAESAQAPVEPSDSENEEAIKEPERLDG
jgi:sec-independent protein translocase protein TatB